MSKFRADNNYSQSVGNVKNNTEAYEVSMHDHSYRTVDPINTAGPSSGQQSSNGIPIVIKTEKRSADSGSLLSLQPGSKVFITGNLPFVRSQTSNVARFQVSSTNDTGGASQQVIRSASQPLKRVSVASSSGIVQQIVIPSSTSPVKTIMPHGKLPITQFKSSPTKVTMVQMNPQIRKPGVVSAQKSNLFSQNSVGNVQSEILPSSVGSIIVQNNPSIIVPVNQGNQSLLVHSQLPSQQQQQRITVKTAVSASAAPASWTATTAKPIKPSTQQQAASTKTAQPRLILPAMPAALPGGVMQSGVVFPSGNALPQLPPGTTILSSSQALPGSFQGYALIPAQFVSQLQQQNQHSSQQTTTVKQETSAQSSGHYRNRTLSSSGSQVDLGATSSAATLRSRKPCNCTKSQCLKLYCDCFANGEFCSNCNCVSCFNNIEHDEARSRAIKACLDRNPHAFHPKIGKDKTVEGERRHNKGCNCKRSGCLKNYCECYEAKILCSSLCKCVGCRNFEESGEQRTLMHLANAAEVRESQQRAVKSKLSSQMMDVTSKAAPSRFANERLPYTFVTTSIAEATCACLVAQAEDAENKQLSERIEEQLILEEFGRCLLQIIDSANKTRAPSPSPC